MARASIYITYHKAAPDIRSTVLQPIHVGRAIASSPLEGMLGDDTGESISELNATWCELTAHYWAWQNDKTSSVLGLMHYRRLLNPNLEPARKFISQSAERYVRNLDLGRYALGIDNLVTAMNDGACDIVVPAAMRVRQSVAHQYAQCHDARDLEVLREEVLRNVPAFLPDLERALAGTQLIFGNIFIMRRPVFEHYSSLLFPVLNAVYDRLHKDLAQRDPYQRRAIGFLAERMLSAYVGSAFLRETFPRAKVEMRTVLNTDWRSALSLPMKRRLKLIARRELPLNVVFGRAN